jgi:hypothetical protein
MRQHGCAISTFVGQHGPLGLLLFWKEEGCRGFNWPPQDNSACFTWLPNNTKLLYMRQSCLSDFQKRKKLLLIIRLLDKTKLFIWLPDKTKFLLASCIIWLHHKTMLIHDTPRKQSCVFVDTRFNLFIMTTLVLHLCLPKQIFGVYTSSI